MTALQQFSYVPAGLGPTISTAVSGNTVTVSAATDTAVAWLWDFGDGTTSTLRVPPPKTYPGPGPYTITLTTTYETAGGCGQYQVTEQRVVTQPPAPTGFQRLVMIKAPQFADGGAPGARPDGMQQSGAAWATRQFFLSELVSHTTEAFTAFNLATVPANITQLTPVTILGGLGVLHGLVEARYPEDPPEFQVLDMTQGGGNGRFNTSSTATGNYIETPNGWALQLSSARTAFACYMTDMGEAASAEVEFRFYLAGQQVRAIHCPTDHLQKPTSNSALFFGFADPAVSFDRVEARGRFYGTSFSDADWVGYDDITVGFAPTNLAVQPVVHHGRNTVAQAAQTVTGPALTARTNWFAAAGAGVEVADFETVALGLPTPGPFALPFSGTSLAGATFKYTSYTNTSFPEYLPGPTLSGVAEAEVKAINSAQRWNTTPGGSRYLEWCEELLITLPRTARSIGFYLTNIGNQNCTIRVMLLGPQHRPFPVGTPAEQMTPAWGGPCYYVPKGAELNSPAGLLTFWGVVNELPFDRIVLQTIFYDELAVERQILPPPFGSFYAPYARIGIDDIAVS